MRSFPTSQTVPHCISFVIAATDAWAKRTKPFDDGTQGSDSTLLLHRHRIEQLRLFHRPFFTA